MNDELNKYGKPKNGAEISPCGLYRYKLWRRWGEDNLQSMVFIMLNPSTADGNSDDPTIRKCIGFAKRLGYGGITILNLFAYRATKPSALKVAKIQYGLKYIVGQENATYIDNALWTSDIVGNPIFCAWGANARGSAIVDSFLQHAKIKYPGVHLMALKLLDDGTPQHPLMLPYDLKPVFFNGETSCI